MATKEKRVKKAEPRRPEKKWGPFAGGTGVAVWLNEFEIESDTRFARTITFSPRRYRDLKTGEWMDAGSYRPVDLAALLLAIQAALDYCLSTPLPGDPVEPEDAGTASEVEGPPSTSEIPY